jgi:hypothetical protein|tara:strand:+ start:19 stop:447 length:429 start_codon:yes stop_codon:yes gene_type:complete
MTTNYPIYKIIVHGSASPLRGDDAEDVHRWHLQNGWDGIGYHWVISEGKCEAGRPEYWIGSHARSNNTNTIGIMLFGTGPDEYTSEQMSILANKCREIAARHPTINDVCGHSDVDPINKPHCPGFDVREWAKKTGIMPRCPR